MTPTLKEILADGPFEGWGALDSICGVYTPDIDIDEELTPKRQDRLAHRPQPRTWSVVSPVGTEVRNDRPTP